MIQVTWLFTSSGMDSGTRNAFLTRGKSLPNFAVKEHLRERKPPGKTLAMLSSGPGSAPTIPDIFVNVVQSTSTIETTFTK